MPALYRNLGGFFFMLDNRHRKAGLIGDSQRFRDLGPDGIIVSDVAKECLSILSYGDILDIDIFLVNRTAPT